MNKTWIKYLLSVVLIAGLILPAVACTGGGTTPTMKNDHSTIR